MSLARKIKRQQMRKTKTADMKAFYDHADRVAAGWDRKEKELSQTFRDLQRIWDEYHIYEKQDGIK